MAETSVSDLKEELRQAMGRVNTAALSAASLSGSRQAKDLFAQANSALARQRPSPAALRQLIMQVRALQ
jgi:hypothetical protein